MTITDKVKIKFAGELNMSYGYNEDGELEFIGTNEQHKQLEQKMEDWEKNTNDTLPF